MAEAVGSSDNGLLELWALERGAKTVRLGRQDHVVSLGSRPLGAWHGTASAATSRTAMLLARYPERLRAALDASDGVLEYTAAGSPRLEVLFAADRVIAVSAVRVGGATRVTADHLGTAVQELRRSVPGLPHGTLGFDGAGGAPLRLVSIDPAPKLHGFADGDDEHRRLCRAVAAASFPELSTIEPATGTLRVQLRPRGAAAGVVNRVRGLSERLGAAVEVHRLRDQILVDVEVAAVSRTDLLVRLAGILQHRSGPLRTCLHAPTPAAEAVTG